MSGNESILADNGKTGIAPTEAARSETASDASQPVAAEDGAAAPLRVAFQGEAGAFSEEAAVTYFGADVAAVPCRDFAAVGAAVLEGDCAYGLLPVENSVAGSVTGAYDVLASGALAVVGEVVRPIRHCLLGVAGARVEDVRRALSHPMALAQCVQFFRTHPTIAPQAVYDTAGAAKEVAAAGDATSAAVAGRRAAELFGLVVLAEDLQDRADNQTRFLVVRADREGENVPDRDRVESRDAEAPPTKAVLVAETANRPGALLALLEPFADAGLNLTKLESRPGREPWTYRFFLELDASAGPAAVDAAVRRARERATSLVLLGSFRPGGRARGRQP